MPTTDKRPLKVFLCHAHADRDAVRALYTRLTNDGMDAWLYKERKPPPWARMETGDLPPFTVGNVV